MAIYGHMTGSTDTTPSDNDPPPPPGDKLSDFENMLDKLNQNIDETLTQRFDATSGETVSQYEEQKLHDTEPHFTLATSPTRKNPQKDEN